MIHCAKLTVVFSAILSDVTTPQNRAKALAHVGIAFAVCFIIGPPIGAYFASRPLPQSITASGIEFNVYAVPAALTVVLLTIETIFLVVALPETRGKHAQSVPKTASANGTTNGTANAKANGATHQTSRQATVADRIQMLKTLQHLHFLFLGVFSGVEFTLTFLTFDCTYPHAHGLRSGSSYIHSVRLEQQGEWRAHRVYWHH